MVLRRKKKGGNTTSKSGKKALKAGAKIDTLADSAEDAVNERIKRLQRK